MSEAERKRSSLREQLSRAKGALADSLGLSANARAGKRAAAESKQRLSAVLWNDRTMAASQAAASDHPPTPAASQPAPAAPPAPPAGAPPLQMPSPHTARARVATPSSARPAVPAGAFAPPRSRRPSPPPPSAAGMGMDAPVPEMLLTDLETLVVADERATPAPAVARTQPPPPPPAARKPPPPPPPARVVTTPPPSAAAPVPLPQTPSDEVATVAAPSDELVTVAAPSAEPAAIATPSVEPAPAAAPSVEPKAAAVPSPVVAAAPAEDDDEDSGWQEPICTRSMARLLAGQGHRDRALAIYDVLLRQDAADASLRAEADALRAR